MNPSEPASRFRIFAICPPGLEGILFRELALLGITGKKVAGGVEFQGDLLSLYSVNLWSRVASRILLRLGNFRLTSLRDATDRVARYPWELYLADHKKIRIRASAHKSKIYHSGALGQRVLKGISKRLGRPIHLVPEKAGKKSPLVFVRMFKDRCQLSIDSSGEHLHKRGFKKFTVRAPIRENLAAAMLLASGWDRRAMLLDPFCGSGTIIMEAILMASVIPPGRRRSFAFMQWKNYDQGLWSQLLRRSDRLAIEPRAKIVGLDKDVSAVEASVMNLENAGLFAFSQVMHGDISALEQLKGEDKGFIVTNPPYGRRLKENYSLTGLYARFGQILRNRFPNWKVTIVCPQDASSLRRALGLPLKPISRFPNGGIQVDLLSSLTE